MAATPTSSPGSASSRRPPLGEVKRLFLRHLRLHAPELPSPSGTPPSPRDPSPGRRGRGCPLPPSGAESPWGGRPRASRSGLSYIPRTRARFAHRMGYGAPHAAVPRRTRPVSPSRAPGFRRRLRGSKPPYASGYSPRLTRPPSSLLPQVRDPGREVPPLDRGTCRLPPSLRPGRLRGPFPLRGSGARGTPGTARTSRTPGGRLGAGRGSHPPRYRPSCRAPQVMASLVSGASSLPQPPGASRHPQHRPAPHT